MRPQGRFGRIDILVNNAGLDRHHSGRSTSPKTNTTGRWTSSLKSVFFACQAAAQVMIPQGRGKIINIGSNFGVVAFKGRAVYAAAKAGVHHLSRALSLEWAKQGVNVNVVAPCITETESRKSDPRTARLQRVGDHTDDSGGALESAGGSRRRGAVPLAATCPTWSSGTC